MSSATRIGSLSLSWLRVAQAVIACVLALALAREMLIVWSVPDIDLLDPFADANMYRAAGERLNAGRHLAPLIPEQEPGPEASAGPKYSPDGPSLHPA